MPFRLWIVEGAARRSRVAIVRPLDHGGRRTRPTDGPDGIGARARNPRIRKGVKVGDRLRALNERVRRETIYGGPVTGSVTEEDTRMLSAPPKLPRHTQCHRQSSALYGGQNLGSDSCPTRFGHVLDATLEPQADAKRSTNREQRQSCDALAPERENPQGTQARDTIGTRVPFNDSRPAVIV